MCRPHLSLPSNLAGANHRPAWTASPLACAGWQRSCNMSIPASSAGQRHDHQWTKQRLGCQGPQSHLDSGQGHRRAGWQRCRLVCHIAGQQWGDGLVQAAAAAVRMTGVDCHRKGLQRRLPGEKLTEGCKCSVSCYCRWCLQGRADCWHGARCRETGLQCIACCYRLLRKQAAADHDLTSWTQTVERTVTMMIQDNDLLTAKANAQGVACHHAVLQGGQQHDAVQQPHDWRSGDACLTCTLTKADDHILFDMACRCSIQAWSCLPAAWPLPLPLMPQDS